MASIVQYLGQCAVQVKDSAVGFYRNHESGCKVAAAGLAVAGLMSISGTVRTVVNITLRYTAGTAIVAGLAMAAFQAFGQEAHVRQLEGIIDAGKQALRAKMPACVAGVVDGALSVPALTAISLGSILFQLAKVVR